MKKIITYTGVLLVGIGLGSSSSIYLMHKNKPVQHFSFSKKNNSEPATPLAATNTPALKISQTKAITYFHRLYSQAKLTAISLKIENNSYIYEISGFDEQKDCNIRIDATNDKIIGQSTLRLEYLNDDINELNLKKLISRQTASQLAVKAANGGQAQEWQLEYDTNYDEPIWTVTLVKDNEVQTLRINAVTKEILDK
ncbi:MULTISPECIES: PepSY domain-containing protein [Lactobacillus]|uniref:PepSY domain-containing protein n=1 Tax=Lactobacillus xujianguonis TaxID=2495899 RepID=A0A437SUS6_9LACO|nr:MULTISPECIES: PepSY domain-containing protein [Lactobacillus]RVU70686.1 hypothetical protein EJK17_06075 [Lactobacillus xujianguonis]RVU77141.1 hypothetical protein EJK20_02285 [Lactobacillus xujianguonis]